jgi:hypothetical protein
LVYIDELRNLDKEELSRYIAGDLVSIIKRVKRKVS